MTRTETNYKFVWRDKPTPAEERATGAGVTFRGEYIKVIDDGMDEASPDRAKKNIHGRKRNNK